MDSFKSLASRNKKGWFVSPTNRRTLGVQSWWQSLPSFRSFWWKPEKMIFCLVLIYFVLELISMIQLHFGNEFVTVAGWDPFKVIARPTLLLLGVICLLIDRPPSFVLAVLLMLSIIYSNLYLGLMGIAHGHGTSPISISALSIWFNTMDRRQIINTALSLLIVTVSATKLICWTFRGADNSPDGS